MISSRPFQDDEPTRLKQGIGVDDQRPKLGLYFGSNDEIEYGVTVSNESPYSTFQEYLKQEQIQLSSFFSSDNVGTNDLYLQKIGSSWPNWPPEHHFVPDVQVRTRRGGFETPPLQYYDSSIQEQVDGFTANRAPTDVIFNFYPRQWNTTTQDSRLVSELNEREVINDTSRYYIMDVDWGDDSPPSYKSTPIKIGGTVKHFYKKPGLYNITGYMFKRTGEPSKRVNLLKTKALVTRTKGPGSIGKSRGLIRNTQWPNNPGETDYVIQLTKINKTDNYSIYLDGIKPGRDYTFSVWAAVPRSLTNRAIFRSRIYDHTPGDTVFTGESDWYSDTFVKVIDKFNDGYYTWERLSITRTAPANATGTWMIELAYGDTSTYKSKGQFFFTGFHLEQSEVQSSHSPIYFKRFSLNILLSDNSSTFNEFPQLGGRDYTFFPYPATTPIVGGINKNSLYYKSISRLAGYQSSGVVDELSFLSYGDKIRAQAEGVKVSEKFGKLTTIQHFDNLPEHNGFKLKKSTTGDTLYGPSELGDGITNINVGQLRVFTTGKKTIEDLLGIPDDARVPGKSSYYKNIIPEEYSITYRTGVTIQDGDVVGIDALASQYWLNDYYYPVLPKFSQYGREVDGSVQSDGDGERTPLPKDNIPCLTNTINDPDLLIDIDTEETNDSVLRDRSGTGTVPIIFEDYKLDVNEDDQIERFPLTQKITIGTSEQMQAL